MKLNTFFDFCSGIGGGRLGLEQVGLTCVGHSDTSRLSDRTYQLMFGNDDKNYGNLKMLNKDNIPDFDVLIAGFPCQTFSVIGRQAGFSDDRGQIIFHLSRIIREKRPVVFVLENVKGLVTHDNGKTIKTIMNELTGCGYTVSYRVLTSLNHGVPQMRQRVYFVGFRNDIGNDFSKFQWPEIEGTPPLSSYLIDNNIADEERLKILHYYLNNPTNRGTYSVDDIRRMEGKIIDTRMSDLRIYSGKCPTLRAQRDGVLYVRKGDIYQLTGYEALLLQGFPREYADKVKNSVSDRHLLMQAGNAMTVNVINRLGKSIIDFLSMKGDVTTMKPGEKFEQDAFLYLKRMYENENVVFYWKGGMDSTKSDISVAIGGKTKYYIEAKDSNAQSGQFVLLPDEASKTFVFSPRNHSEQNEMTDIMISYMNGEFDRFNNAGTAGEELDISSSVFSKWIIEHYKSLNVKYVITHNGKGYVVFPVDKYADYFDISANYRIKKSGSGEPANKDISSVQSAISSVYPSATYRRDGKKLFVSIPGNIAKSEFPLGKYTYLLAPRTLGEYEVRRLSNTYNMNVIFSIELVKDQDKSDLEMFISDLK